MILPNPWMLLGGLIFWCASIGAAWFYGGNAREDSMIAAGARDDKIARIAAAPDDEVLRCSECRAILVRPLKTRTVDTGDHFGGR